MAPLEGLYNTITVQKSLQIKNKRLGVIFRILQLAIVGVVFVQIYLARAWTTQTKADPYGLEMWTGMGTAAAHGNHAVKHCSDYTSLQYNYSSDPNYWYMPTDCKPLPAGEKFVKSGLSMYFPTFVTDNYVVEKPPGNVSCATLTCGAGETKIDDALECKCTKSVHFFAKNAEENMIYLNHGFATHELDPVGGATPVDSRSVLKPEDYTIRTVITMKGDKETKCNVGGKSVWAAGEILAGPLKDWVACAGFDLDQRVELSRSNLAGESGAPPIRIQGLNLVIKLDYVDQHSEDTHEGPVCYVEISAVPVWNGFSSVAYTTVPKADDRTGSYRARYAFGISVSVQATGTFLWFDFNALILVITSSVVLLSLPGTLVQMIALNLVGRLSKIYGNVAAEKFGIVDRFHSTCAKLLGYKAAFDNLTASTMQMNGTDLETNMNAVLEEEMASGLLSKDEVAVMTQFMLGAMDTAESGFVSLPEFLHACDREDPVKLNDLAGFFDKDNKGSILERIFGDVRANLDKAMANNPALAKHRSKSGDALGGTSAKVSPA